MPLPYPPNVTVAIYLGFNPNTPYPQPGTQAATAAVAGYLKHHMKNGRFGRNAFNLHWTHKLFLPDTVDIRDAYNSLLNGEATTNADTVLLGDYPLTGFCCAFMVVLVQRVPEQGLLRVYLDRARPQKGPCTSSGIILGCCNISLPATLYATIKDQGGCLCLDGATLALVYDPVTQYWLGNLGINCQCGTLLKMSFAPIGNTCFANSNVWCGSGQRLTGVTGDITCNPFQVVSDISFAPLDDLNRDCCNCDPVFGSARITYTIGM
jgi:hypothetical protein